MSNAGLLRTQWLPFASADGERETMRARIAELEAERVRLLEHLRHVDRVAQAGLMTAGLAHDLANQLTVIAGTAEVGLMNATADSRRTALEGVLDHARRMNDTLDAFLSFMRRGEQRVRVFSVAELVSAVQRLVEPFARAEGVVLLASASRVACLRADLQLLEQALVNLTMNAVRAAATGGGRVTLTACDLSGGRVRICVRDTGCGIADDVLPRLFEPFVTANAATGGHGLGMFVARQVIEHYGGTIDVATSCAGTRIDIDLATVPAD